MQKDRFIFGSFSGMIGGIIALLVWALPAKMLGWTDRIFYDWGMVIILFKPKYGVLDYVVGILAHFGISGLFGILFAGLIYLTSSKYLILKGTLYGVVIWLTLLSIGTLFRLPLFTVVPANSALVTYIGSGIYGFIMSISLKLFHKRFGTDKSKEEHQFRRWNLVPSPAMKKNLIKRKVRLVKPKKL